MSIHVPDNFTADDAREIVDGNTLSLEQYRWRKIVVAIYEEAETHNTRCDLYNLTKDEQKKLIDLGYAISYLPNKYVIEWK